MTDPYTPPLSTFAFTQAEQEVVTAALADPAPWDWSPATAAQKALLKSAKDRILAFHLQRHNSCCCYCRTNLHGAGPFMTDREHVLPKGNDLFRLLAYTPWNLAASCKRCNMQLKKADEQFIVDTIDATKYEDSGNYLFVHPNFDRWSTHLSRKSEQDDEAVLVRYRVKDGSDKGAYTFEYFSLRELETDTLSTAQGRPEPSQTELATQVRELAEQYGQ